MKNEIKPGPKRISPYSAEIEKCIKDTFSSLTEKDRRLYAAVEALKLPRGGDTSGSLSTLYTKMESGRTYPDLTALAIAFTTSAAGNRLTQAGANTFT